MVIISGAGLAGSILARVLELNRIRYKIFDCELPWRASPISENLFSLTWKDTLGEKVFTNGLKTLESIVDIKTINFKTKAGHNEVLHVPYKDIKVDYLKQGRLHQMGDQIFVDCRGYWARVNHIGGDKMIGLTGQGLIIKGNYDCMEPTMNFVSPYVHQKFFKLRKDKWWYGDSTCIEYSKYKKLQDQYEDRCVMRAVRLLGCQIKYDIVHGIRPWVNKQKGFLELHKHKPYIVNTGGWKCGLIIYADHAQKIVNYIKNL